MSTKDVDMIPKVAVEVEDQSEPNEAPQPTTDVGNVPGPTPRAPKSRPIEELETASPSNMTRLEAIKYIKHLREENIALTAKINALEENTRGAFAKAQFFERIANAIDSAHDKNWSFILSSIRNLLIAIEDHNYVTSQHVETIKKGNL